LHSEPSLLAILRAVSETHKTRQPFGYEIVKPGHRRVADCGEYHEVLELLRKP